MRNQRGVTLIALVVTIIVLLILAGVSIAMLTGDNGILTQATSSRTATARAEAVEKINMTLNTIKTEIYRQQVDTQNWEPLNTTGTTPTLQSAITTTLTGEGFVNTASSGDYAYELVAATDDDIPEGSTAISTGDYILKLTYYNDTTEVATSTDPITGIINLDDDSDYTLIQAE